MTFLSSANILYKINIFKNVYQEKHIKVSVCDNQFRPYADYQQTVLVGDDLTLQARKVVCWSSLIIVNIIDYCVKFNGVDPGQTAHM